MVGICRRSSVYNASILRHALIKTIPTAHRRWYTARNSLDTTEDLGRSSTFNKLPVSVNQHKYPLRGGQNLTNRFRRLERSLRGKDAYKQEIIELKKDGEGGIVDSTAEETQQALKRRKNKPQMFMGFVVPDEPKPPADDGMTSSSSCFSQNRLGL